jgi:hypothetical protein
MPGDVKTIKSILMLYDQQKWTLQQKFCPALANTFGTDWFRIICAAYLQRVASMVADVCK